MLHEIEDIAKALGHNKITTIQTYSNQKEPNTKYSRRAECDLTFSADKSISICFEIANEKEKAIRFNHSKSRNDDMHLHQHTLMLNI